MERIIGLARGHWQLAGLTLLIVALWQSPVLLPLRILVVFFHELSHALATIATGGTVVAMSINAMEGGQVTSLGGNRFLALSAGYTGSLLIGVALVVLAVRTSLDRLTVGLLGVIMLLVAAAYLRDAFALAFTGAAGAALASPFALRVFAIFSAFSSSAISSSSPDARVTARIRPAAGFLCSARIARRSPPTARVNVSARACIIDTVS